MRTLFVAIVLLVALSFVGCTRTVVVKKPPPGPKAVVVVKPPPPPRAAVRKPPRPGSAHVWVPGHYVRGSGGYCWVSGAWRVPPRTGRVWVPGRYAGGRWVPGRWR